LRHIIAIVGPTASGKTRVGIEAAPPLAADYQLRFSSGLSTDEIATAKVPFEERRGVPIT